MWVSFKKQELLTLRKHLGSPPVFGVFCVAHLFSFVWYVLFVFILCCVCPTLPVSLDCPFLIALARWLRFSFNVYYTKVKKELLYLAPHKRSQIGLTCVKTESTSPRLFDFALCVIVCMSITKLVILFASNIRSK